MNIKKAGILFFLASTPFVSQATEKTIDEVKFNLCNTNTLHYAASINDKSYVNNLLTLEPFNLTEYDNNCDTVYHIAVKNNNIDILEELFNQVPILDIKNLQGENLTQYAVKNRSSESLVYLINKGIDPREKSSNDMTTFDYQEKYGDIVTKTILKDFENSLNIKKHKNYNKEYKSALKKLTAELGVVEIELLKAKKQKPDNKELINSLQKQVDLLKSQIETLKSIIIEKEKEIDFLKNQLLNTNINISNFGDEKADKKEASGVVTSIIDEDKEDIMVEISNDGDAINDSMKIFNILSKPIYKIKEKE